MDREADRRDAPRVSLGTLAVYSLPRADGHYNLLGSGQAKDLSISGAGLRTREALPAGAEIDLRFQLSGNVRAARARVVWAQELEPERAYEAGVRFLSVGLSLVTDIFARVRENHGTRTRFEGRGLLELVGLIAQESLSGLVAVDSPSSSACLAFRKGRLVGARAGGTRGRRALLAALGIARGEVSFFATRLPALALEHEIRVPPDIARALRQPALSRRAA